MDINQFFLALALYRKSKEGQHVALLTDDNVIAIGVASAVIHETAMTNLLHNYDLRHCKNPTVFSTDIPSEMCLGLAWQRGVRRVVYLDNFTPKVVSPTDEDLGKVSLLVAGSLFELIKTNYYSSKLAEFSASLNHFPTTESEQNDWITHFERIKEIEQSKRSQEITQSLFHCTSVFKARVVNPNEIDMLNRMAGSIPIQSGSCTTESNQKDNLWMKVTYALAGATLPESRISFPHGHNVAAIMVNSSDQIIGWGVNINRLNSCLHAETSMILAYLSSNPSSKIPDNVRIYSTLAPCHMCAGLITRVALNASVVIGHSDPRIKASSLERRVNGSIQCLTTMMPIVQKPIVDVPELRAYINRMGKPGVTPPTRFQSVIDHHNPHPKTSDPMVASGFQTPFAAWMIEKSKSSARQPSTGDWLSAHHSQSRHHGVTTFLRESTAPKLLFTYSLDSLEELLDVCDAGERIILQRGIDLIKKIRSVGLIH